MKRDALVIVGGGLVGSLAAIFLARRGFQVEVHERRSDLRGVERAQGRSINLVVTSRGIHALAAVGLWDAARRLTVPVRGRMVHSPDGAIAYQPYGRDDSECNYSIPRLALNQFLIDHAESSGVRFRFGSRLLGAQLDRGRLTFGDESGAGGLVIEAGVVIGADGAASAVRSALAARPEFRESFEPLAYGYKELHIPPVGDRGFRIAPGALHVWPRGRGMLMALPNSDGSFTVTLYLPHEGSDSFGQLEDGGQVRALFEAQFPDALPSMPQLETSFFENPTGILGTLRCSPWHAGGRAVLLGDAAHAIVPFFGQGMNCGFEDCTVLDRLLVEHGPDWKTVLPEFDRERKPNADAIADMAMENFIEMRDLVGDPAFRLRKQVELRLERERPGEYRSRYSMIAYSLLPYAVAQRAGRIQGEILDVLCAGLTSAADADLERARALIHERLTPLLR